MPHSPHTPAHLIIYIPMNARSTKRTFPHGSGILQEAIEVVPCVRNTATHFIIFHGDRLKYIISLNCGIRKLKATVAAYNCKLKILLSLLPFIPMQLLVQLGIGVYAKVKLHKDIQRYIPEHYQWNVLIGTYDATQKIVLQCFSQHQSDNIYIKIGNAGSDKQMLREIQFLRSKKQYNSFSIPKLIESSLMHESGCFNILVTNEFKGTKILPHFTEELYRISREIAGKVTVINGVPYEFSHGDFAPWNIRKTGFSYTVFDWEHCGMRPIGYDAIYFIIMTEIALHHRKFDEAFEIAEKRLRIFNSEMKFDKHLIRQEFAKTAKSLQF